MIELMDLIVKFGLISCGTIDDIYACVCNHWIKLLPLFASGWLDWIMRWRNWKSSGFMQTTFVFEKMVKMKIFRKEG